MGLKRMGNLKRKEHAHIFKVSKDRLTWCETGYKTTFVDGC
jgi:hypothetical protein